MRICIVSPRLYHYLDDNSDRVAGGAQRQLYYIADQLSRDNIEVVAIVADCNDPYVDHFNNVKTIMALPESLSSYKQIPTAFASLTRAMYLSGADAFLTRGSPRLSVSVFLIAKLLQKKVIFHISNDSDLSHKYITNRYGNAFASVYFRFIQSVDRVVAQTPVQQNNVEQAFSRSCVRIPNGYPIPDDQNIIPHDHRQEVLWVGTSDRQQKRPMRFIELAESLPDIDFRMISKPKTGSPEYHTQLSGRAEDIQNLTFQGPVQPSEIHQYYRTAAMLVNTSEYEGFPNTYLEAWRYATPIVSFSFDVDNLLTSKSAGYTAHSMSNLKEMVLDLCYNPSKRSQLGQEGRRHMQNQYSIQSVGQQYRHLLDSLVES